MLAAWLPDLQVRRAFADWMRQIVERLVPSGVELPPIRKLEDVSMTLVERAAEWSKEWLKEGLSSRGSSRGSSKGLSRGLGGGSSKGSSKGSIANERCCAE